MADGGMNWDSRLAIKYTPIVDGQPGEEKTICPIDSFTPTFAMNAEPMHSIEAINIGVVYMPEQITFNLTVKAVGSSTAQLTMLALKGQRFNIVMEETEDGEDWSLTEVLMTNCIITNANPSSAAISGAPTATFSGFALGGGAKSSDDNALVGAQ